MKFKILILNAVMVLGVTGSAFAEPFDYQPDFDGGVPKPTRIGMCQTTDCDTLADNLCDSLSGGPKGEYSFRSPRDLWCYNIHCGGKSDLVNILSLCLPDHSQSGLF